MRKLKSAAKNTEGAGSKNTASPNHLNHLTKCNAGVILGVSRIYKKNAMKNLFIEYLLSKLEEKTVVAPKPTGVQVVKYWEYDTNRAQTVLYA